MRSKLLAAFLESKAVCTDTRQIEAGAIFFALKGDNFDGNKYARQAINDGCSLAVIDDPKLEERPDFFKVDDVLTALQHLAEDYRNTFDIPFLAITGSNGKTTTKELVHAVLSQKYRVHSTAGNFNNHIGVPLTLLSMPSDTEIAIIEMGANHVGEIADLCLISHPNFGMITNIGKAHLDGFGGLSGVIKAKSEMYTYIRENSGRIFRNADVEHLEVLAEGIEEVVYHSEAGSLQLNITRANPTVSFSSILGKEIKTQLTGVYNMHNFASAIALGQYFKVPNEDILVAIRDYTPTNKRSQIENTERNTVILDAYNANPTSMTLALQNLSAMEADDKFFVIGDMMELGSDSQEEHEKIVQLAIELGLSGILVGKEFGKINQTKFEHFDSNTEASKRLESINLQDYLILVKGSRGIKLEEVMPSL
jgi:UDP-N-acetylmuramoyl-tripeptide--D-alanyl-D-alanine ligase